MNLHYAKEFKPQLIDGTKIHTLRKNDVASGTKLSHIIYPYHPGKRECLLENQCISCQEIKIEDNPERHIWIDQQLLTTYEEAILSKNDGFDTPEEFWSFFKGGFYGYIIHWTDFKY